MVKCEESKHKWVFVKDTKNSITGKRYRCSICKYSSDIGDSSG